jgi:hypothetical protein
MKVLLIWDSCGQDDIALYFVTGDSAEIALNAHGQYINSTDDTEAVDQVNDWLSGSNKDFTAVNTYKPGTYDAISICGFAS